MQRRGMRRPSTRLLAACLLAVPLVLAGGCTLVDQRTFNPDAGKPPVIPLPPGPPAPKPVVTIDFATPNPDYTQSVREAVEAALSRKPDAAFEVATVVPATGTPADQVSAAQTLTPDARQVAREVAAEGVPDERIALTARAVPGLGSRQVQVFAK